LPFGAICRLCNHYFFAWNKKLLISEIEEHLTKSHKQNPYLLMDRVVIFRIYKNEMALVEKLRTKPYFWQFVNLAFR
jgi:hypothetical protein